MTGYACTTCPLAFEVGYFGYWDLSGCCSQYVCCSCGTMHRIEHREGEPDVLFALPGPIPKMVSEIREDYAGQEFRFVQLPISEQSWQRVGNLPTSVELQRERIFPKRVAGVELDRLSCSYCGKIGRLVSNETPTDEQGNWPVFGENCPKCGEHLELVYVSTIN